MALRLARLFGNSPEFWLNAQRAVDLWDATQAERFWLNLQNEIDVRNRRDELNEELEAIQPVAHDG